MANSFKVVVLHVHKTVNFSYEKRPQRKRQGDGELKPDGGPGLLGAFLPDQIAVKEIRKDSSDPYRVRGAQ